MDKDMILKVNSDKADYLVYDISSLLRMKGLSSNKESVYSFIYTCYLYKTDKLKTKNKALYAYAEKLLGETRALFIKNGLDNLETVKEISERYSQEDLFNCLVGYTGFDEGRILGEFGTPNSISKLALRILDINKKDSVADFGCGFGLFITEMAKNNTCANIYGVDVNTISAEICRIKMELLGIDADIELKDMFAIDNDKTFDKIFSNYPFGMRIKELQEGSKYLDELCKNVPGIKKATSSDWIYNSFVLDHLNKNGKAVAIMTNGGTFNSIDAGIREYFVRGGFVEAVISLPARLFPSTMIPTTLIVISRGNKKVRMVDAQEYCKQGRRMVEITDKDIDKIVKLLSKDSEKSVCKTIDEMANNDFSLNPARYLAKDYDIKNGVEFGSIIKSITRGAPLSASDLDKMASNVPTKYQYLKLSNIQNGMISDELPYLNELDSKLEKYCIKKNDLLLSKNGAPFKIAVAEFEEEQTVLGNGSLFIIQLNEEVANPYYFKAFFNSEIGMESLKRIAVGASIPNISAEALKKLIVPLPSIEDQNKLVEKYRAKTDEIKILQLRLKKAQDELNTIFEEG